MIITVCKKWTADKKFPACSFFPVLIYDDQVTIVTGNADRKCFLIGKSVINNIVTANIGCFCRTEKICVKNIRKCLALVIQLLYRHNFSGKQYFLKIFRFNIRKCIPVRYNIKRRRNPVDGIYFISIQIFHKLHRE